MTIAEIRGKISRSGSNLSDRMEDLLTSDVFGPLRYLPFAEGLLCVLGKAKLYTDPDTTLDAKIGADFSDCTDEPEVCFWLRMENSEPDVLIKWGSHLVMIEAKYLSGKSGDSDSGDAESATPDQLAREFHDLSVYKGKFPNRTLIYLTAHSTLPQDDLESSCKAVGKESEENKKKFEQNTYWLSWFDVRNAVEDLSGKQKDPHRELVLDDISCLLHQKGFRGFEGFGKIEIAKVPPAPENIFYRHSADKFRGSGKLAIAKVNPAPEIIFYQPDN